MEALKQFADFFLHLDSHMSTIVDQFGAWTYVIIFLIIFVETGVVVMPFLPGDSLLFVLGTFAATDILNLPTLLIALSVAAIVGDTVNYFVGAFFASKITRFIKPAHLERTQKFYDKYGARTIIIARFIPIVRTIAPFMAGVGKMKYSKFIFYNIFGGVLWVFLLTLAGYFFGNLPIIKNNFEKAILGIIFVSLIPVFIEWWNSRKKS